MLKKINFFTINIFDKIISIIVLIIFFPILIIIIILLFFFNDKDIFYISERIGFKQKPFKFIKFRTMKKNSDEEITKIGKILRRTSIDEIPQLINVLIGEMSIVGPRPYPREIMKNISEKNIMLRHNVKPGITGYSQIFFNGKKRSLEEKIFHDIFFVKNYSLWLYLLIIFKTPYTLLKRYFLNPTGKTL
jgi:lipopolysaccharide/colanic/teichoic acid biosynthesis glycosyltransferase